MFKLLNEPEYFIDLECYFTCSGHIFIKYTEPLQIEINKKEVTP